MGQSISLPVIISPTGVQAVDPDGEVAAARVAAARGTAIGPLDSFASKAIEEVTAVNSKDVLPDVLDGDKGLNDSPDRAFPYGWGGRVDPNARLVVLLRARLGQPLDSRAPGSQGDCTFRSGGG